MTIRIGKSTSLREKTIIFFSPLGLRCVKIFLLFYARSESFEELPSIVRNGTSNFNDLFYFLKDKLH